MGDNQTGGPLNTTGDTPTKKKSKLRLLFKAAFALVIVLAVGSAVVFYLARSEPGYWKEHQKLLSETTPQQLEQLAEQVEGQLDALAALGLNKSLEDMAPESQTAEESLDALASSDEDATDHAHAARPKTKPEDVHINVDKIVSLNNKQLAAFVQTRLDDWMAERGYVKPEEIKDPMVRVSDGDLVMAFLIQTDIISQVVSGRFDLVIRADGYAELTMERFLVGNLPVPANAISEHLQNSTGDKRAAEAGQWLSKLQYLEFKPVIKLDHRRRARVQDYQLMDNGLELTVRVQDHKTYKAMNTALAGVATD